MAHDQVVRLGRRRLLQGLGALSLSVAGGSLLAGCANQVAPFFAGSAGSRPETTTIRLPGPLGTCIAPELLAVDMLRAEGFDVKQVPITADGQVVPSVGAGDIDMAMQTGAATVTGADTYSDLVHLAGIHIGCFELFASAGIRSMNDLKGKRVSAFGYDGDIYLSAMAANIGLDMKRDFALTAYASGIDRMQAFTSGQVDAFLAGPPQPHQLRKLGHNNVIVNMHRDRPWSQYYCCVLIANRAFVQNNPVATKQVMRAILKATDLCAEKPDEAADLLIARGDITDRDAAIQMFRQDASYNRWREYDPEDTIRFYGLLLHQVGMVKSTPDKLIAQSTDWRILNELKRELKA